MNYDEVLKKYTFLAEIKNPNNEEIEVTEEVVRIYCEYDIYNKDWTFHKYNKPRKQMSMGGSWLYKENENTIHIVGDILTAKSAFEFLQNKNDEIEELYYLFERIYHTLGNCMPWCEGGNLGGRPYKDGGSLDYFTRKLETCKKVFDGAIEEKYKDTSSVNSYIIQGKYLGGLPRKTCLYYWLIQEWIEKGKNWECFAKENYLIDMVNEDFIPIPFVVGNEKEERNISGQSDIVIKKSLIQSIKLIIKRGYRIQNRIKMRFDDEDENYKNVKIFFGPRDIEIHFVRMTK